MTTNTQGTPDPLAAKKAAIAKQQAADLAAITDSETALHLLADKLHAKAFANEALTTKPSFADSLKAAATEIIAKAGKDFPAAALANLQRYAPAPAPAETAPADPIAAAEEAAESTDAVS